VAATLAEAGGDTLRDALGDVKAVALLNTLDDTLAWTEVKTIGETLGDVKAEALIDTLPAKPPEAKAERHTRRC